MRRYLGALCRSGACLLLCGMLWGCASVRLDSARSQFYAGAPHQAAATLEKCTPRPIDRIMFLMERGTIRQALQDFDGSTADWIEALRIEKELETHSVSKAAASMVVNDRTLDFRGAPYERTLLRSMLALNFLAQALWDSAAVEGRNIVFDLKDLNGYPDDAFSRYVAGFTLELVDEDSNAALQYRNAQNLVTGLVINPDTGWLGPAGPETAHSMPAPPHGSAHELVCFIAIGRSPPPTVSWPEHWRVESAPYAEIRAGGQILGRSYPLANTGALMAATERRRAAIEAAKTAARIVLKKGIADAVRRNNNALGDLLLLALFAMEQPDTRRWETLPLWLEVARVPCPADLKQFEVVFVNAGAATRTVTVTRPITRRRNTFVSFCRDVVPPSPPTPAGQNSK